ncbi:hypothetical protein DEJ51_12670 [Streptomyces venezuelae]|uniref:Uncharacterized protein n=1 Tax=Streptomyces venezuelae TaxID=54571 RepID=A0A5P2DIN7_STRVZ|nr:hypothetical protein DEJ51_12670 [Streptomyces venezuelae]
MLRNDTSEITSAWLRGSQAEICYWAPYSLCGTKPMQKVFISPKIVTHATGTTGCRLYPYSTCHLRAGLRSGRRSGADHIQVTEVGIGFERQHSGTSPAAQCTNLSPCTVTG